MAAEGGQVGGGAAECSQRVPREGLQHASALVYLHRSLTPPLQGPQPSAAGVHRTSLPASLPWHCLSVDNMHCY